MSRAASMDAAAAAAPRYRIGVADGTRRDAVEAVRRAAYRGAAEFDWTDEATLAWSAADDAGMVLVVLDAAGGAVLSTLRFNLLASVAAAEAHLEYSLAGIDIALPTLAMSRAATLPEQSRHGLFALLRHAYLSALCRTASSSSIGSVIAIVYEGGPRLAAMREAGYEFFTPCAGWDSEAAARSRPLLAVLPRPRFDAARRAAAAAVDGRLDTVRIDAASIVDALRRCGAVMD